MRFLQMMNFTAPYLPWVLLGFSVLLHNNAVRPSSPPALPPFLP